MSTCSWSFTPNRGGTIAIKVAEPMTKCQREYVLSWVKDHLESVSDVVDDEWRAEQTFSPAYEAVKKALESTREELDSYKKAYDAALKRLNECGDLLSLTSTQALADELAKREGVKSVPVDINSTLFVELHREIDGYDYFEGPVLQYPTRVLVVPEPQYNHITPASSTEQTA